LALRFVLRFAFFATFFFRFAFAMMFLLVDFFEFPLAASEAAAVFVAGVGCAG
jgi:hypothetical protein